MVQFPGLPAWKQGQGNPLREVKVAGRRVLLVRRGADIFAMSAKCPHAGGPLAEGFLDENGCVVCPWHRFSFAPETGTTDSGGYFADTYELQILPQAVKIAIPKKKWWQW